MTDEGSSGNPNRLKNSFAYRFIGALSRIRRRRPISTSSGLYHGGRRIKLAADASMAYAVGSRRAWSRAILRKIKVRPRYRRTIIPRPRSSVVKKKKMIKPPTQHGLSRENRLRSLIPGGESMDICSLLDETAHYIRCLSTQVQVMQNIAGSLCS